MIDMDSKTDISEEETAFTLHSIRPILPQVPRLWPIVDGSVVPATDEKHSSSDEQGHALLGKIHNQIGETIAVMWHLCEQYHVMFGEWPGEVVLSSHWQLLQIVAKVASISVEDEHGVHVIPFGVDRSLMQDVFVVRGKGK